MEILANLDFADESGYLWSTMCDNSHTEQKNEIDKVGIDID